MNPFNKRTYIPIIETGFLVISTENLKVVVPKQNAMVKMKGGACY